MAAGAKTLPGRHVVQGTWLDGLCTEGLVLVEQAHRLFEGIAAERVGQFLC